MELAKLFYNPSLFEGKRKKKKPTVVCFLSIPRTVCPDRIFLPGYFLPYELKKHSRESEKVS